jgi:hypothetical protein
MQYFWLCTILLSTLGACNARGISDTQDDLAFERKELLKVAYTLEKSLNELRRLEKAKAVQSGLMDTKLKQLPQSGAMETKVTMDWEGPLEPLLEAIAEKYHYKPDIMGKKPVLPIWVVISTKGKTLGNVIQDIDLQVRAQADISINDAARTIELRYVTQT